MLDYNDVKKKFLELLAANLEGIGRLESAAFHTVEWVYAQGIAENKELIERLEHLEEMVLQAADLLDDAIDHDWPPHEIEEVQQQANQLREIARAWQPPQMGKQQLPLPL